MAQPLMQGAFVDAEISGDLTDRGVLIPVLREPDDIVTELSGVGLGHDDNPSRPTIG